MCFAPKSVSLGRTSKLLTERSPVVKRVMVAETNTDAADSFCAAPGGTGHRDMARSESSARELGRPVPAQAGGQESDGTVVATKRVMTVERRVPACMAFQTETAERDWPMRPHYAKGERPCVRKWIMVGAMHRARSGRNSRRKPMRVRGCAPVKSPKVTFGWKSGFVRKCADAVLAEAGERRAALAELAESEFDTKKICYDIAR